jgi:hypothetical protein
VEMGVEEMLIKFGVTSRERRGIERRLLGLSGFTQISFEAWKEGMERRLLGLSGFTQISSAFF